MRVTYHHNGFHGYKRIAVNIDGTKTTQFDGGTWYIISPSQARRLNMACCSGGDCRCYEHIAVCTPSDIWIAPTETDLTGHYPQHQ